jgi:hypothetical protein
MVGDVAGGKVAFWGDRSGVCGYPLGAHKPALTNQIEKAHIEKETIRDARIVS